MCHRFAMHAENRCAHRVRLSLTDIGDESQNSKYGQDSVITMATAIISVNPIIAMRQF